jgi:aspartokinase/homoserine dehydrogenase 1
MLVFWFLARYPQDHPFAQLQGSDNMVAFTTQRYCHTPLIVRGPGAGAAVTAAGVFSDLLQVLRSAGAPT